MTRRLKGTPVAFGRLLIDEEDAILATRPFLFENCTPRP